MFFILRPILYDDPDMVGRVGVYDSGSNHTLIQGTYDPFDLEPKSSWAIFIFHKYWSGGSSGRQLVILSWSRDETCPRNWTYTSICFWILGWNRLYNWILGIISHQSRSRTGQWFTIVLTIIRTIMPRYVTHCKTFDPFSECEIHGASR